MALLRVLSLLREKYAWTLTVAHVNYALRGQDSLLDEKLVKKTASSFGLPMVVKKVRPTKNTSEEKLRTIRYAFFEELLKDTGADAVVLAHHRDDQAETLLLRLLRGTGSFGLQGMRPKRGRYLRPFLDIPRADILEFLEYTDAPYREDATNAGTQFQRNRVRNELLPLLEKHYNPNIRQVLSRLAETAAAEQDLLRNAALNLLDTKETKKGIRFSRQAFLGLSQDEQMLALRALCQSKTPLPPTKTRLAELRKKIEAKRERQYMLRFRGLKVQAKGDMMTLLFE